MSQRHERVLRALGAGREADAMTAPNHPRDSFPSRDPGPLRLRMAADGPRGRLDGVWWPRSRDLLRELPDLVDHFPAARLGRVVRVLVSPPDWDVRPRHVLVRGGYVKVGAVPDNDSNLVHLTTSDRTLLRVLVAPPSFTRDQGQEALQAAGTHGHRLSAEEILRGVTQHPTMDPSRPWTSRGAVTWWSPDPTSSS